jgi:hypothetical protein
MTDERITAYLLQELTEEEAERFEEQCFAEEEWPAELESAEQDLIDAYLNNKLSKKRRLRFEENYLTTDVRKARVLTAHSFHKVLPPPSLRKVTLRKKLQAFWQHSWIPQTGMAIVLVGITIALLAPVLMRGRWPPRTFQRLDLAVSSSDRSTGGPSEKVTLPIREDALEIYLRLPEQASDAASYRVRWKNLSENLGDLQIASKETQSVVIVIPAGRIKPGQYALQLFKIDQDGNEHRVSGNYFFTAEEPGRTR